MATVKFKRKTTEEIAQLEIEDGSIIFDKQAKKIYLDDDNTRIEMGGSVSKEYVDDEISKVENTIGTKMTEAKTYTDGQITETKSYTDQKNTETKQYIDQLITGALEGSY